MSEESQALTDRLISIFEAKLKGHNVVMQKEVGLSTVVSAVEAMKEYAEPLNFRIKELEADVFDRKNQADDLMRKLMECNKFKNNIQDEFFKLRSELLGKPITKNFKGS